MAVSRSWTRDSPCVVDDSVWIADVRRCVDGVLDEYLALQRRELDAGLDPADVLLT